MFGIYPAILSFALADIAPEMEKRQIRRLDGHVFLFLHATRSFFIYLTDFSAVAIFLTVGCKLHF